MPKIFEAPPGFVLNPDYLVPELRAQRDALLEALKAFTNEIVPNNPNDPIWVNARAAIAKAEEA